jgi:hypothetical protein
MKFTCTNESLPHKTQPKQMSVVFSKVEKHFIISLFPFKDSVNVFEGDELEQEAVYCRAMSMPRRETIRGKCLNYVENLAVFVCFIFSSSEHMLRVSY